MTLSDLQSAVTYLFPTAVYGQNYTAAVDAQGNATINLWSNALGMQPTPDALATALNDSVLDAARTSQIATLTSSYQGNRWGANVTIPAETGGTRLAFPLDPATQSNVMGYLVAYQAPNQPPKTMPLLDASGVVQQLTYSQLSLLAGIIADRAIAAFTQYQDLVTQVKAATTVAAIEAVMWPIPATAPEVSHA